MSSGSSLSCVQPAANRCLTEFSICTTASMWNSIDGEMLTVLTSDLGYDFIELPPSSPSSSRD